MSNFGQAALTIGGAALGVVLPGVGWALGATIGSMAGSALFPTDLGTVSGPRLNDLNVQSSAVGAPIPIVYGTYAIAGNVIWSSGIIETVSRKRQGGKGGPTQTTKEYTYKVNCAVGVCEGEVGSIRRIWADAKLIYDARAQLAGESDGDYAARQDANTAFLTGVEIYLGTSTQLPDPTLESFEGSGNVSAFRDLVYVVFSDFQLAEYGNRVPNFRFEVSSNYAICTESQEYSNEILYPWLSGAIADPRNPANNHEYRKFIPSGSNGTWGTYAAAAQDVEDYLNARVENNIPITLPLDFPFWSETADSIQYTDAAPYTPVYPGEAYELYLAHYWITPDTVIAGGLAAYCDMPSDEVILYLAEPLQQTGIYYKGATDLCTDTPLATYFDSSGSFGCFPSGRVCGFNYFGHVGVRRKPGPPTDDEDGAWSYDTSVTYEVLSKYLDDDSTTIESYPLNPARPTGHPENTQAFWEAAYAAAVVDGDMAPGLVYGVDYPISQAWGYTRSVTTCTIPDGRIMLGEIVRQICLRTGLLDSQIDVSDLTEMVDGYVVTRVMSGRDAIAPLRSYGWFDCVESDGVLKWPTRGKLGVFAFTDEDLAAHIAGDSRPSSVETDRQQEVELPRRLRVHYAQTEQNYEPGEQGASRLAAGDVEVRDLEVAVAMSDTKAARIADVVLYDLWWSRNRIRAIVDQSWLDLEPADAGTMPLDGRQERVRIVNIDHALPGLLRLELVRDDDGVYQSYAIGAPAAYAGTGGGAITTPGTADLVLLDLPLLRDADNDAGYYAAVRSIGGTTWSGAVLYRSPDAGANYDEAATVTQQAIIGDVIQALGDGPTTIIDEGGELVVAIDPSEDLESISEVSLLAGLNAAAIGADGRWEIIQFRDAVLAGSPPYWTLSGLLRGRRGTEWAVGTGLVGDTFVFLDSAVTRVPLNIAGIAIERPHKAVLVGTSIEGTAAVDFTPQGVALRPFSVVDVDTEWDGGDLLISWIRRGRIGSELPSGADIPLSEESEAYEVDIVSAGSPDTVVRTISATTQAATYSAAQQTADFGMAVPAGTRLRIYQLSATVGRGYVSEVTL